ncbi:sodium channel and clathrin linker 1-like [Brachionus plicatilis]|uniref:Sodium channel and clathrin linker 1-like n=1 Tax=Brachionus plicatilis TaxID=10195 RepID=A0A3M7PAG5_BRAPC|nr:sodium channel and clathrin linker 1-like [Brachionus plicatilis]
MSKKNEIMMYSWLLLFNKSNQIVFNRINCFILKTSKEFIKNSRFGYTERNNLGAQVEKLMRAKKNLEIELEKASMESLQLNNRENSSYEDIYRRFCAIEREKEQALLKLENKESELKKLREDYENNKEKNHQIISEFTEKSYKTSRELEKFSDEHAKVLNELDDIRNKLGQVEAERNEFQKKVTKQIQLHESESQLKNTDYLNKIKNMEDTHSKSMFELRQLLNMQQRMSNKWKEECHTITQQSEAKFLEMKNNFENLRHHSEKLTHDLQQMRVKDLDNERKLGIYSNKIKNLEQRCKDAEYQATEATKRIAKQLARERMIEYEKHLLESNLEKNNFIDTLSKGKKFLRNANDAPEKLNSNISYI